MRDAVIVSAVRTAVGKAPKGMLRATRPDDLAAVAIQGALARVPGLDKKEVEDVIIGCAMPEGEQGMNVARIAALRAGMPIESSAMTINRYCASGLQSIALAAERIRGGGAEAIVAGGTESMSFIPFGGNKISINPWLQQNYPDSYLSMGLTAERVARHYGISRQQADEFALASHTKALAAQAAGKFEAEIVPVPVAFSAPDAKSKIRTTEGVFQVGRAAEPYGRALGREHLDALILAHAIKAGTEILQPCAATQVQISGDDLLCKIAARSATNCGHEPAVASGSRTLRTRCLIAAHGSWESGTLPTQTPRCRHRASDLFAFKAHFRYSSLAPDLMPLLVFPGGYGGMVSTDSGRTSLSCCIRRDALAQCRLESGIRKAAPAVLTHILAACKGAAMALAGAELDGSWLAAGPIRPGIRSSRHDGIFPVGNAAGEAHPIVAEGIGMAIQSAWLLCDQLIAHKNAVMSGRNRDALARDYAARWRLNFAPRLGAAAVFAHLAMRPLTARLALSIVTRLPAILTLGAYLSGKAQPVKMPLR